MPRALEALRRVAAARFAGLLLSAACVGSALAQQAAYDPQAFEIEAFRTAFEHEVRMRAAAIEIAWGAEPLCDHTTEIEPFVLASVNAKGRRLNARQRELFGRATGMDDRWRLVWMDESVPEEIKLGDVVVSVNGKPLPAGETKMEFGALFRGQSIYSGDDQGLFEVLAAAREEAVYGKPMTLELADGRRVPVSTQTGCAGAVGASAFDTDPDKFWRQGNERVKIPANAMREARSRDEFRWLAAFGTFYLAHAAAVEREQSLSSVRMAISAGKILALTIPGAGMVLSAVEARAEREIAVDGIVGRADVFATEVVAALGGDPGAGLAFLKRLRELKVKTDVFDASDFRLSSMEEHVRSVREIQAAQRKKEPGR
ncbi:MAG: hypothetical protein ACOYLV_07825 [Rubrivivax sp.]